MNLAAVLRARAEADGRRVAIHADARSFTRRDVEDAVDAATRTLRGPWAVARGDRVAYLGLNRFEELVLLFALARIGAIFVPLNTRLAVTELAVIVAHADPCTLVTEAGYRDIGEAVLDSVRGRSGTSDAIRHRAIDDLTVASGEKAPSPDPIEDFGDSAPVLLVYTSGTTGAPKGALHTHGGLVANARASIAAHAMSEDDRVLTVLPLFHVGGLCIQTVPALLAGASLVLHPRFDATTWLESVATMRPTLALMVPATLRAVLDHPDWKIANLSCLRVIMAGSSTIPRTIIDAIHARGVPLGQIYGSTETGPVTVALGAADARAKPGFAGWPCFDGSVRLVGADGDVAPGSVGEIVVRAPNVMHGYWRMPSLAATHDGWFATGDLGRFDEDGCLEVVGRSRDLIISGGENVYPSEIEDALLAVPGVAEACVVAMQDERWGEVPAAFVVRGPDGASLDAAAIEAALRDRLARFKCPKRIVVVERLPRNAMGKVQRHLLYERLAAYDGS